MQDLVAIGKLPT